MNLERRTDLLIKNGHFALLGGSDSLAAKGKRKSQGTKVTVTNLHPNVTEDDIRARCARLVPRKGFAFCVLF